MLPLWIQKLGKTRLLIITTIVTLIISNLITATMSVLFFGGSKTSGVVMATIIPILLGMPLSYLYIRMLFELHETRAKLETLSITDELTQAYNRRFFIQQVKFQLAQNPAERPFALFSMDFDNFKQINDQYGHPVGDLVLQRYTDVCKREIRSTDIFARIGGDEFALLLPDISLEDAEKFSHRLLDAITQETLELEKETIRFTISIGLTMWTPKTRTTEQLLLAMDQALYQAKNAGKNQVVVFVGG